MQAGFCLVNNGKSLDVLKMASRVVIQGFGGKNETGAQKGLEEEGWGKAAVAVREVR